MNNQIVKIGDRVRHKSKFLNSNAPMNVSDVLNNQVLCDHHEPNEEGGNSHKKTWFPVEELAKIIYG